MGLAQKHSPARKVVEAATGCPPHPTVVITGLSDIFTSLLRRPASCISKSIEIHKGSGAGVLWQRTERSLPTQAKATTTSRTAYTPSLL
ncbi:MAG TPA: hypothetical protein VFQ47_05050 [Nitrososphaera sp.]|nr:hypothetical protein [Nitrososphaera sp.]